MAFESRINATTTYPGTARLSIPGRLLRWAARRARRKSAFHQAERVSRTLNARAYDAWRGQELRSQLTSHFDAHRLRHKDVLDFGCGTGELSIQLATTFGCRSVIGVDTSAAAIERAGDKLARLPPDRQKAIRVIRALDDRRIDLPDASVDYICCFDVVEHIPRARETVADWRRVLRPGGEVWIWWSPWRGPYGHHVDSLIPLPWVHLVFSATTIFTVCAEVYDDPTFVPRAWDLDPQGGRKRPNKWRSAVGFEPFLNRLTRRQFEQTVRQSGFVIARRQTHGFGGSAPARATRALTWIPVLGECFVSFYAYRLVCPR